MEPKCFCCPDCKHSQIFKIHLQKNHPRVNICIRSPLTKSKNVHLKERKNSYFCQPRTEKQIIQVSNIHSFFFYILPPRMPGLVKLLTIIDWKGSQSSKIILMRVNFPLLLTAGRVISFSNLKDWLQQSIHLKNHICLNRIWH